MREARAGLFLWPALFLAIVAYGLALLRGGYLHYEGQFFLSNYLDGRGFGSKLFSAEFNEWGCYQGRELSFLFNFLDAQAIVVATRVGVPFLYSATSVVAVVATAILLWRIILRMLPRLSRNDSGLIVSLWLLTPPVALSHYYYRPTKALVIFFFVLAMDQAVRLLLDMRPRTTRANGIHAALLFVFATLMGASDRLGVFLIIVAIVVAALVSDSGSRRTLVAPLVLALAANIIWSSTAGPRIGALVDGFPPDTGNEHIPLRYAFANPQNYVAALSLWRDHINYFFGNWGSLAATFWAVFLGLAFWTQPSGASLGSFIKTRRSFLILAVVGAMMLASYVAMFAKLSSLVWEDSRRVYYWLPALTVLAVVVAVGYDRAIQRSNRLRFPLELVFAAMIVTSAGALHHHRDIINNGDQRIQIAEASRVRACMREGATSIADFKLTAGGSQACTSVRLASFGSSGPGPAPAAAIPNPLLWCLSTRRR